MKFKKFIRAEEGEEKNSVVYYDEDENKLIQNLQSSQITRPEGRHRQNVLKKEICILT